MNVLAAVENLLANEWRAEEHTGSPRPQGERSVSVYCIHRKPARWVCLAVCEWHKAEGDPVCVGCNQDALRRKWTEGFPC